MDTRRSGRRTRSRFFFRRSIRVRRRPYAKNGELDCNVERGKGACVGAEGGDSIPVDTTLPDAPDGFAK